MLAKYINSLGFFNYCPTRPFLNLTSGDIFGTVLFVTRQCDVTKRKPEGSVFMAVTYGKTWRHADCIIRRRGDRYQVELSVGGKRRRESRETVKAAEDLAVKWKGEARTDGEDALVMSRSDRLAAVELLRLLPSESDRLDMKSAVTLLRSPAPNVNLAKPLPSPLAEAVRFWIRHHPRGAAMPTLDVALAAYVEKKAGRRPATLREYRDKIGRLQKAFPGATVADITTEDLDRWICRTVTNHRSRRQYLTVMHGFFKFVCRTWHLENNPAAGVYLDAGETDQTEVEAYTVEEVKRIMAAAEKHAQAARIVPMFAIGFFAGLRPSEISGLTWDNVALDQRQIRVTPATAKRRRQRFVAMSDNLVEWLRPYAKAEGKVASVTITSRRDRAEVLKTANVDRWIHDGLRHSFGTYHLAAHADANKTANEMGHRGNTDLVYQHYRKLVTQADGLSFWQIVPAKVEGQNEAAVTPCKAE